MDDTNLIFLWGSNARETPAGDFKHARLYTPEDGERSLEVYKNEEGSGVDIDKVSVCATLRLD